MVDTQDYPAQDATPHHNSMDHAAFHAYTASAFQKQYFADACHARHPVSGG